VSIIIRKRPEKRKQLLPPLPLGPLFLSLSLSFLSPPPRALPLWRTLAHFKSDSEEEEKEESDADKIISIVRVL
jgi:hypothetical protein